MAGSISAMLAACRKLDGANLGYDQSQRWTFYSKGKVIPGQETDCSACCGAIAQMGGYPVDLTGTFYTGNFAAKLKAAGFAVLKFTKVADCRPGDFLLTPGKHVEFVYDKTRMWSAVADEKGGKSGGKDGDQTGREVGFHTLKQRPGEGWTYIIRPPKATAGKPDATTPALFRLGQANLHAEQFGGPDDAGKARGVFLKTDMACSVYALCEVSEDARYAIRDAMGGQDRWKVFEVGFVCVMWDATKWGYTGHKETTFGTNYHGAVRAELVNKSNGLALDVISVHVRPAAAIAGSDDAAECLKVKHADIRAAVALARKGIPTVLAGDFNTSTCGTVIEPSGFVRATPAVDTVDKDGEQKLDAVFVTPNIARRGQKLIDPGTVSDHKCWVFNGTLSKPSTGY